MIAAWMLYAAVVGALLAAGAAALDRALRAGGRATRFVWAGAIAASLLLPVAAAWRARAPLPAAAPAAAAAGDDVEAQLALLRLIAAARERATDAVSPQAAWDALDRPLLALWGAASVALLAWLALSHRALHRRRRAWREAAVDDEPPPVLVAPDVGPAVVGLADARVVLPAWALGVGPRERSLILAHEREHLRAGDPLLLAAATAAAALVPWSPAAWWQLRRLRLAVEIDCDRRVLRRHPDVRAYGGLLLDVARRAHPTPRLAAAALASPATSLERRIRIMTSPRSHRTAAVVLSATAGVALAIAACEAPRPTAPRPESRVALSKITAASADVVPDPKLSDAKLRGLLQLRHPELLATKLGHQQRVWFVVDAAGAVVKSEWDQTSDKRMRGLDTVDPSTIESVEVMKLAPGRVAPDSIGVVWIALKAPGRADAAGAPAAQKQVTIRDKAATAGAVVRVDGVPAEAVTTRPDGPVKLSIRGTGQPTPLFLLDGREISADAMKALSPDSIASIDVLKGAAATAVYGDKGTNGVVRIVSKTKAATRDY